MTQLNLESLESFKYAPEHVNWVIDQIAIDQRCPIKGSGWAGKEEIVHRASSHLSMKLPFARGLVERAIDVLYDQSADPLPDISRRIMIRRLEIIVGRLQDALMAPREKRTYKYVLAVDKNSNPITTASGGRIRRRAIESSVMEDRVNPGIAKVLLDYLNRLAALQGIHDRKDEQTAQLMLNQALEKGKGILDSRGEGLKRERPTVSVKNLQINLNGAENLGPEGLAELERTLLEKSSRPAKKTASRPITFTPLEPPPPSTTTPLPPQPVDAGDEIQDLS